MLERSAKQVSIPVGFFQALQLCLPERETGVDAVSIPVGFFQALQPLGRAGFSRSPNPRFNPCRVFSGLATLLLLWRWKARPLVSIPVGFFQALQQPEVLSVRSLEMCFNPCRVFSGLATVLRDIGILHMVNVSIPVGFFQALQRRRNEHNPHAPNLVSIPVGFFQALQLSARSSPAGIFPSFNPCRVFSGLATLGGLGDAHRGRRVSIPVGFFQALPLIVELCLK